jgi:predicted alpha/beta superfamily hydrolase
MDISIPKTLTNLLYLYQQINSILIMKKLLLPFILIFLLNSIIISQIKIKITVTSNSIGNDEKVFIAGNQPELGNWNPGFVSLEKVNDSTWIKEFSISKGVRLEFKFTKGSWNTEELNPNGSIPWNKTLKVANDTLLYFRINKWKNAEESVSRQITGKVRYHYNFKGNNILPRDIIVWLPPSYDSLLSKYYPVLYMQDGQNIFDPATSSFGIDWQIDESADSLIKAKAIKELIIVGIYNTSHRSQEYVENNTGYAYLKFIVDELKPFIDRTYRTLPDRQNTAVGGSSLGALISFLLVWEHSVVFSGAACLSPAFKIADIDLVKNVSEYNGEKKKIKIYIDIGGIGIDEKLQLGVDEMVNTLRNKGYVERRDLYYFKDPTADHNEKAWSKRVWRFLEFLFAEKE